MLRILTAILLMLTFCGCLQAAVEYSETDTEQMWGDNAIENIRNMIAAVSTMTSEEKSIFLAEANLTEDAFNDLVAMAELNWKGEGRHRLPKSNSTLTLPRGYALVIGKQANALHAMDGEPKIDHLEALVCDTDDFYNSIMFQYFNIGYVSTDGWNELDSKALLQGISKNTERDNIERRKNGSSELHIIGWIQEPTLDKDTNTVYWAIEIDSAEEENIVNSVAMRLGRKGFEKITWISPKSSYIPFGGHLEVMLSAHSFDPGYRYNDYTKGDKRAEYGIEALVAATVGGEIVKAGSFGKILGGLIFAGLAVLIYKFRNFFRKKKLLNAGR